MCSVVGVGPVAILSQVPSALGILAIRNCFYFVADKAIFFSKSFTEAKIVFAFSTNFSII